MASKSQISGRGELEAAKKRLAAAKAWELTAESLVAAEERLRDHAEDAKSRLKGARDEARDAETYLESVERKWEVIDVDDDTPASKMPRNRTIESKGQTSGRGEIEAAKKRLAAARKWESSTVESLEAAEQRMQEHAEDAKARLKSARDEARDAEAYLESVERKWEAIGANVDALVRKKPKKQKIPRQNQPGLRRCRSKTSPGLFETNGSKFNQQGNGNHWVCQRCTLENPMDSSICEACSSRRGSTRIRNGRSTRGKMGKDTKATKLSEGPKI